MIIVLFPVAFFLKKSITKNLIIDPTKKDIWINKWRIYLSIFLTGATIITDLIILINTYLGGEISTRFILKVLATLIISGILFTLFFFEKKIGENQKSTSMILKIFLGLIIIVTLIFGFMTVGSPTKQRNLRFDTQRINDLSNIQWQVVNYWQQKGKLPTTLANTTDSISGIVTPKDPETKSSYGYSIKGDLSFELCADFSLKYEDMNSKGSYAVMPYVVDNWQHDAGRTCFTRTIDPEKYPKIKQ
jgi:hypothetical protein